MSQSKKCVECGTQHSNKSKESNYQEVGDRCFNCSGVFEMLQAFVEAQNRFIPSTGRPRKLTILSYKIEKV